MRGRKPLPSAVKRARGTDQPCRMNPSEPRLPVREPPQPDDLDDVELRHWRRWCDALLDMGVLSVVDGAALESLAIASVRRDRAHRGLRQHGAVEVNPKTEATSRSAWAREFDAADAALRSWCALFGATPSDRTRLKAAPKPAESGREARRRARRGVG